MKIVVLDGYPFNPGDLSWEDLAKLGDLKVYDRTSHEDDEIVKAIEDAEIIFTNKTPLTGKLLAKTPSVKYIGVLATGYNVVEVGAARELGIVVTNVPAYSTDSVAQLTFALLLEMCHHVGEHNEAVQNGDWCRSEYYSFWNSPLIELAGKTMGIIGYGMIGQAVGKLAQAFGMNVLANNTKGRIEDESALCKYADLDHLLAQSDIISLHCPFTEKTNGMINSVNIAKMKDGVMIINTSRGGLVVEKDLKEALNSGKVSGAAVDVVSVEPIIPENELLKANNCLITPHIAWATRSARRRLIDTVAGNVRAYLAGAPCNVVG